MPHDSAVVLRGFVALAVLLFMIDFCKPTISEEGSKSRNRGVSRLESCVVELSGSGQLAKEIPLPTCQFGILSDMIVIVFYNDSGKTIVSGTCELRSSDFRKPITIPIQHCGPKRTVLLWHKINQVQKDEIDRRDEILATDRGVVKVVCRHLTFK